MTQPFQEGPYGERPVVVRQALVGLVDELSGQAEAPFEETARPHRILSYFTGEIPIHAAAMLLDSSTTLEIYYDACYYVDEYSESAKLEGFELPEDYALMLGETVPQPVGLNRTGVVQYLARKGRQSAQRMKAEAVSLGVDADRIRLCYLPDIQQQVGWHRHVSDTHKLVADAYFKDEEAARKTIGDAVFGRLTEGRKKAVETAVDGLKLSAKDPVFLLWVRRSGLAPGGAYPELDMPDAFLEQIRDALFAHYGTHTQVLLVGDDPGAGLRGRRKDMFTGGDLIRFWRTHDLTANDRAEQVYFLTYLASKYQAVAIGMESGALEMPALLGVPTVYLERRSMRGNKAVRWTYVSGALYGDPSGATRPQRKSGAVSTWRRQQFEAPTEWLFPVQRLDRIVDRVPAAKGATPQDADQDALDRLAKAAELTVNMWHATVVDYEEELSSTIEDGTDWVSASRALKDGLWHVLGTLNPDYALGREFVVPEGHPPVDFSDDEAVEAAESVLAEQGGTKVVAVVSDQMSAVDRLAYVHMYTQALQPDESTGMATFTGSLVMHPRELHRLIAQIDSFGQATTKIDKDTVVEQSAQDKEKELLKGIPWNWQPNRSMKPLVVLKVQKDPFVYSEEALKTVQKLLVIIRGFLSRISGIPPVKQHARRAELLAQLETVRDDLFDWAAELDDPGRTRTEAVAARLKEIEAAQADLGAAELDLLRLGILV